MTADDRSTAIARLGTTLGPMVLEQCRELFGEEQARIAESLPPTARDCAYGPDPRHRLDLYRVGNAGEGLRPVLLFVHGGGFVLGDKGDGGNWANAHVGRWAARAGLLGAVMNYRLAPDHGWPAGGEDIGAAVDWLRNNAAEHGGDPDRIFLLGTSAGAVHIATFIQLRSDHRDVVRAAALLSGLYGFTPLDDRDQLYYGSPQVYAERMPRDAIVATDLPLFLACARFDPLRFQREWTALMQARLERFGHLPCAHFANGHNHYSMAMHLGSSDHRLADELLTFFSTNA